MHRAATVCICPVSDKCSVVTTIQKLVPCAANKYSYLCVYLPFVSRYFLSTGSLGFLPSLRLKEGFNFIESLVSFVFHNGIRRALSLVQCENKAMFLAAPQTSKFPSQELSFRVARHNLSIFLNRFPPEKVTCIGCIPDKKKFSYHTIDVVVCSAKCADNGFPL